MSRFILFVTAVALTGTAAVTRAADVRDVAVRVEPPQRVLAIALESNGTSVPVAVINGRAKIPAELPLPWRVAQLRFEPTVYTQADLEAQRPLLLREYGRLTGAVREGNHPISRDFAVVVRANGTSDLQERKFSPTAQSAANFETLLPGGTYQAVIGSDSCGTRLRSGIVIKPGATTDLGLIACEPTFSVSFRVLDSKTGAPVEGASVVWDPVDALNAEDAKVMYARRWSGKTDRRGAIAFKVGPAPIPVRWRIEAGGYAIEKTRRFELSESKDATVSDVKLRPSTVLRVRIHLPAEAKEFDGGAVVLGERPDERSVRFTAKMRQPIRDGEVTFPINTFGEKRVWLESAAGTKLCYRDIRVEPEAAILDLSPESVEIHGRVIQGGSGVEKAMVVLGDPHDGRLVLANVRTDAAGAYSLRTYQSGELSVYATEFGKRGLSTGAIFKKLQTTAEEHGYELDFELPAGGITVAVVDAETHAPIVAKVKARFTLENGNKQVMNLSETDDSGRLIFTGYPEGVAALDVSALGYRTQQVQFPLHSDATETHDVALAHSHPIIGRVISPAGAPVPRAVISAGYDDEWEMQGHFETVSDASGRFQFDSPPDSGTPFYVVAEGWALSIVNLDSGTDNVVKLSPPSSNALYLIEDNAPPKKLYRVAATPVGGYYIPSGVLQDLAEANGMNAFQLLGSGRDGAVVLPQFLAPGTYDFFITLRPPKGETHVLYERVGRTTLPSAKAAVLRIASK
jgi:hypothetical protein